MITHKRALLASTVIATSLISSVASAQTNSQATSGSPTTDAAAEEGQTIVVTGSLLTNPNLAQAAPVNVTTAEEITLKQSNVAEEVLRDIPGIVPSVGSAVNNGNGGASFVDLRGLGSFRNIVLLDGQRVVPAGLVGRVDLNNIPLALVERVEALTGGASTTYGADAVSGVVNFITRKDFSGVEMSLGEQITEQGDGNYLRADVTLGANFDDGRGNAVFSIGYQESDPVYQGDRNFSRNAIDSFAGAVGGSGTAVPTRVTGTRNLAGTGNNGNVYIDPATGTTGVGSPFNFNPYNIFQTPFKRYNMYGAAHYQASDSIEIYTRGIFSKNNVKTIVAPSGAFGIAVNVNLNNPYLPAGLRNQFCAFDVNPSVAAYQARFTQTECDAAALATGANDPRYRVIGTGTFVPFDIDGNGTIRPPSPSEPTGEGFNNNPQVSISRRAVESGPRINDFTTTFFDYRAGLRGGITDTINWDVSGAYGENENVQRIQGYTLNSRFRQALLANNTTTCQDTSNGCVPVNIFGAAGTITPAQVAILSADSTTSVKTTLAQARGLISGDLGVTSPWANDAISFAAGGEYRRYTAQQLADQLAQSGDLGGAGGATPIVRGGYDVYEAIGEVGIPLVSDKPFFESLQVNAGIRYSHYTVDTPNKPKFNTTTYKAELIWQPVRDIKFRGGYARAVRAPNISELFAPVSTGLTNLATDPCAGAAPVNNANLRAVCLAQGAPAGQIGAIQNPTGNQANVTGGGDPNIQPEKSTSYTFGVVLQPSFVRGFSATVDYYNIEVKNAISVQSPDDIIAACFGNVTAASATSPACTSTRRNSLTGGLDGDPAISPGLAQPLTNLGRLRTDGVDVALNYRTPLEFIGDDVKLAVSFSGNYTFHSRAQAISRTTPQFPLLSIDRDCVGLYSVNCASIQPKFQWNQRTTLTFGDIDLSLLWQHIDGVDYEDGDAFAGPLNTPTDPYYNGRVVNFNHIKAYNKFDFATRFGLTKNVDLTIAVQNLFDKTPPITGYNLGSTRFNSGNTYPASYDALGRKYAVGVKMKF